MFFNSPLMFLLYITAFLSYAKEAVPAITMPLKYLILLIIAACNIAWAFFIWLRNPKDKINIFFGLAVFFCGLWAGLLAIIDPLISSPSLAMFLYKVSAVFTLGAAFNFYIFSYYFPFQKRRLTVGTALHIAVLFILISILTLSRDVLGAEKMNGAWIYQYDPVTYLIYALYIIFYFCAGLYYLLTSAPAGERISDRAASVVVGVGATFACGVIFGLFMPYFVSPRYEWIAPYLSLFMIGYISYVIFIKR